ncbi:hypothetical protein F4781DRAFT_185783 [Annulohypoxylon bovei var. microspora]|nr:hypothetical protein F4781DRAFT_185783 [Annulohypoxylon bovei var. microspora]
MVIKDALIKLSENTSKDDVKLFKSIYAIYFFGAPNRGLNNDALLQIYGNQLPGQIIRDLGAGSALLNTMNESWIGVSKYVKIVTCFELCVTPTSRLAADDPEGGPKRNGSPAMMVSRDSACYYTENETRIPINANHSMLAKLDNQPGSAYYTIARAVQEHVQEALNLRDRECNLNLNGLKQEAARLHATIAVLQDMVAECADRTADTQFEAINTFAFPRASQWNPFQDARHESILVTKGIFFDKYESGFSATSKDICKMLLEGQQAFPNDSLFQDSLFQATCEAIRKANEARLVRDISPLIVPSAETFALRGDKHLDILIESVNQSWSSAILIIEDYPQPNYSLGFRQEAFTESQLKRLESFAGELVDNSYFRATESIYFPFLSSQVGCGDMGLEIADRHNMHSMTIAVRGIVELYKLVKREKELNGEVLAFSISHSERKVRIYGHYAVDDGSQTSFYRHLLRRYDYTALNGRDRWAAYQFTRNIYDVWVPIHLRRICSVVDELPLELVYAYR